jgi:hypothetical protein
MSQQLPTALELWFDGNFVCRWGELDVFQKGNSFYAIWPKIDNVHDLDDEDLKHIFR